MEMELELMLVREREDCCLFLVCSGMPLIVSTVA